MLVSAAFVPGQEFRLCGFLVTRIKLDPYLEVSVSVKKPLPAKKPAPVAGKGKPAPKVVAPASIASILGRDPNKGGKSAGGAVAIAWTPASKVRPEWKKHYQDLLDRHDQLRLQISGLQKESQAEMESYSLHMGDSGTDNFDRDLALGMLSSDQEAMFEIEEALRRIEKGTYGVCELTGKKIPKTRLDVNPWARFTVEAQSQLEKEGALRQRNRIGSLGSVETSSASDSDEDDDGDEKPAAPKASSKED